MFYLKLSDFGKAAELCPCLVQLFDGKLNELKIETKDITLLARTAFCRTSFLLYLSQAISHDVF